MSFTTHSGIRRSTRLSKKVSPLDYATTNVVPETHSVVSETSSVSSQVFTPRRSKRIAALRVLPDNKSFSQFEQLVDTIVEKKFRFNPVNEIITHDVSPVQTSTSSRCTTRCSTRYPTRDGTRISYAQYFDNESSSSYQHRHTRSKRHYNLRSLRRVDYSSL